MKPEDEAELDRLTEMLREIDATLATNSPLVAGLQKAALALHHMFLLGNRADVEASFESLGKPLTQDDKDRLRRMGIDPAADDEIAK